MRKAVVVSQLLLAGLLAGWLLVGCSGSATPRSVYLLRAAPAGAERSPAPLRITLSRVTVAPYLDQSGIVVETEVGQVQAARLHLWAEPLNDGLLSYLRAEVSAALGYDVSASVSDQVPWDYTVDVYVDQLHGTMTGTAVLDAGYRIAARAAGGEVAEYRFSSSVPLPREGYPGVVAAETDLARQLARAIAANLRAREAAPANP